MARQIMATSGPSTTRRVVRKVYNETIRPRLPRKYGVWAGVAVRTEALFDADDRHVNYKQGFIDAIHEHVQGDDTVTLVGGGRGVSTVHCLRAGAGHVVVYEAAEEMVELASETVSNEWGNTNAEFRHALVGEGIEVYGDLGDADIVAPSDLETNDVLILDCEGAERSILGNISDHPETAIVETHPERSVPTKETRTLLTAAGYTVTERMYEPDQAQPSKRVLVGEME